MTTTMQALSQITDDALFERLSTAVLRDAIPEYHAILHCGINSDGKTVKSPLDGIGFIVDRSHPSETHLLAVHHTTCKRGDLPKKWLHDPSKVKGKKTAPAGDFVKTQEIVASERTNDQSLRATLVLTTNREPPEALVRKVKAAASANDIAVDFWTVSRIAHHLDHTASGQWLRRKYLNVEAQRLSPRLLQEIARKSLELHRPNDDPSLWVTRELDLIIADVARRQEMTFVVAESGLGKSVACHKYLRAHVEAGGFGLVIPHQCVASALSIEQAVEAALRQLHPHLLPGCEVDALNFCSSDKPLVLVVEDINKSGQVQFLTERLIDWGSRRDTSNEEGKVPAWRESWRLFCPLWPQAVSALGEQSQKRLKPLILYGSALSADEAREAVHARALVRQLILSDLDADRISEMLGYDPLLIALYEPAFKASPRIIDQFIDSSLARLAHSAVDFTAGEYREALRQVATLMLSHRSLAPTWKQVTEWTVSDKETRDAIRQLARHAEIARISGPSSDERLAFRHDRVRDALLKDAISSAMKAGSCDETILSEPFYAELIGSALLREGVTLETVEEVKAANPLALFHALRELGEPNGPIEAAVIAALVDWLDAEDARSRKHRSLRWQAAQVLSGTNSSAVTKLVRLFPEGPRIASFAMFRNGDLSSGLHLCRTTEPGVTAPWHDRQIEHARIHFGDNLVRAVAAVLRSEEISVDSRIGALRLAGYLASPVLGGAIEASWQIDAAKTANLDDYLWAMAYCCADDPERFLMPICDAWAALPSERDEAKSSSKDNLAANHIRWAFRARPPTAAISYFVRRGSQDDLKWPMMYMLHTVDHPTSLEFVVREIADQDRRIEAEGGWWHFSMTATREWERSERRAPMSIDSRVMLQRLWEDRENDNHLRSQALRFWSASATEDDLDLLRPVDDDDTLAGEVLWQRVKLRDHMAVPRFLEKLQTDFKSRASWWHLAPGVWCDDIQAALLKELECRGRSVGRCWESSFASDYAVAELLTSVPPVDAERLMLEHWDHLHYSSLFVQAALYWATPKLLAAADKAIKACPQPKTMFKYINQHYGIRTVGRRGVVDSKQVEVLAPYLDLIDEHAIHAFWELCNDKGWFDIRRNLLDAHVSRKYGRLYLDEEKVAASFDDLIDKNQSHWIDSDVDAWLMTGVELDHIMDFFGGWLKQRRSVGSLQLVANAVTHAGNRKHLDVLDVAIEPLDVAEAIRLDTAFAVKRRSLN